jgi:hypothetical protein
VAHACNPSYSGQKSGGSQPEATVGKKFERPYHKKPYHKIGLVVWLKMKALSSSPSTTKKKERKKKVASFW